MEKTIFPFKLTFKVTEYTECHRYTYLVACVAGGISHASAFMKLNASGEAVRGLVANSSRDSPVMEYGGSVAARPLTHPASYAGYPPCESYHYINVFIIL